MISELFVHIADRDHSVVAGKLERYGDHSSFRYSPKWLDSGNAFPLDPLQLPLNEERYIAERIGTGTLSVFVDSMPDQWGKKVISQNHPEIDLDDPFELLQITSTGDRVGTLEFSTTKTFNPADHTLYPLEQLYEAIASVEGNTSFDRSWRQMLDLGSSPGGARPKSFFYDDRGEWLAKFPSRFDHQNQARVEAASLRLLELSGVEVPYFEIIELSNHQTTGDILLLKRFDRTPKRCHIVSAATLLTGLTDSYLLFSDQLRRVATDPQNELKDLFRRMVFNISISNRDDHSRNHAMIYSRDGYRLTPAFDVVIGEGNRKGQSMATSLNGYHSSVKDAVDSAHHFFLEKQDAWEIIEQIDVCLSEKWTVVMDEFKIEPKSLKWALTTR